MITPKEQSQIIIQNLEILSKVVPGTKLNSLPNDELQIDQRTWFTGLRRLLYGFDHASVKNTYDKVLTVFKASLNPFEDQETLDYAKQVQSLLEPSLKGVIQLIGTYELANKVEIVKNLKLIYNTTIEEIAKLPANPIIHPLNIPKAPLYNPKSKKADRIDKARKVGKETFLITTSNLQAIKLKTTGRVLDLAPTTSTAPAQTIEVKPSKNEKKEEKKKERIPVPLSEKALLVRSYLKKFISSSNYQELNASIGKQLVSELSERIASRYKTPETKDAVVPRNAALAVKKEEKPAPTTRALDFLGDLKSKLQVRRVAIHPSDAKK